MTDTKPGDRLLQVRDLHVDHFDSQQGRRRPLLNGVNLDLEAGQAMALVGPSGCGKSITARALLGLLPTGFDWRGQIAWKGQTLNDPDGALWRQARGKGLGLILQEPQASLNPVMRAGDQVAEALRLHRGLNREEAWSAALSLLAETQLPDPHRAARSFPHQLSGGMRQRVLLAATLACDPDLLIADEPTTALDVSVQKEILALIRRLCRDRNMALLFITHDLNLAPLLTDQVAFMSEGRIKKVLPSAQVPLLPSARKPAAPPAGKSPILRAADVSVSYGGSENSAVSSVELELRPGQAVGLLGESGCGKTSLGRALSGQIALTSGTVTLAGNDLGKARGAQLRTMRRQVQMLFQDPGGSLDPRQRVQSALNEASGTGEDAAARLLVEVGLDPDLGRRYPHQLSGGQRQRVALARCLAPSPSVLIADEPTSALDGEAQNLVLSLLERIMGQRGLALLLISHDLEVLQGICAEVKVMFGGRVVESLPGDVPFLPLHPYSRKLVQALPRTLREDMNLWVQQDFLPSAGPPVTSSGCPHFGNCPLQKPICGKELPPLKMVSKNHWLRCPEAEAEEPPHFIDT